MKDLKKGENYINRELSWLNFNFRVLSEAKDKKNPLFERLKFLSITSSNLDEFFMVRVASLKNKSVSDNKKKDASGMTVSEQLEAVLKRIEKMVKTQYSTYSRSLLPQLNCKNIFIAGINQLSEKQEKFVREYFENKIYPALSPVIFKLSDFLSLEKNKTLNICALIKNDRGEKLLTSVRIPPKLKRVLKLPREDGGVRFILIEEIIRKFLPLIIPDCNVLCSCVYRITRSAEIPVDENNNNILDEIEKNLKKREYSEIMRLEVSGDIKPGLYLILKKIFKIEEMYIYKINGPLDLTFLNCLYGEKSFQMYKYGIFKPRVRPELSNTDLFEKIRKRDILLYHPYDSFLTVIDLMNMAAEDKSVTEINQTLYRVSDNSPVIKALCRAAENGKRVNVIIELKARFDEKNNIKWAKKLKNAGCNVMYGVHGVKTHSKIIEIIRREKDGIRRYIHLGTGNYNDVTSCFYSDIGLLTCSEKIGADADAFFNALFGGSKPERYNKLVFAPEKLRSKIIKMINREIKHAGKGEKARIIIKVNSLSDPEITALLYKAGYNGVKVDLIVRGICALRAGVDGFSENISVKSIVGRYLEHTRIYYFYNNGRENVFCSSADLMRRNLDRRIEIMFPVEDDELKKEVINILDVQLSDIMRSYIQKDGVYKKADRRGGKRLDCQEYFMKERN